MIYQNRRAFQHRDQQIAQMPIARAERATRTYPLWLVMAAAGLGMGAGSGNPVVILMALVALAVAVTLWVRELRESRRG